MAIRCPGQDTRFWKPEDIFEAPCFHCGKPLEFWKDEPKRICTHCGKPSRNPKIDLGCAAWCQYARECTGATPGSPESKDNSKEEEHHGET